MASESSKMEDADLTWERLFLVGPAGSGKRDLSKRVYDKLIPCFDQTASVTVGSEGDMNRVFKDILQQLSKSNDVQYTVTEDLSKYLKDTKNKYLILITDICDSKSWEMIRNELAHTNHDSRVIATYNMATNDNDGILKPWPAGDDANHQVLFYRAVLGAEGKCWDRDNLLEIYNKEVDLKKCGGVPLVIIASPGLLANKPVGELYKSVTFGTEGTVGVDSIAMSLSFYGLPSCVMGCLMHLSNVKWTNKSSSIWKWVAEGFLRTAADEGVDALFEVGEKYFAILKKTSMIEQVDMYEGDCYLEGCRMTDIVLHFVRSLSSRVKFVWVTDKEVKKFSREASVSRLAVLGGTAGKMDQNQIRKMVAVKSLCVSDYEVDKIFAVWSGFKVLRVLDLIRCTHRTSNGRLLTEIGKLVELRYLSLEGTPVDELEEEDVENISCLQTLDLRRTGLKKLPWAMGQLAKLVCLWADDKTTFPAGLLGKLTSLQDLQLCLCSGTPAGLSELVSDLGKLTQLRSLSLRIALDQKLDPDLAKAIGGLEKMRNLVIRSSSSEAESVISDCVGDLPGLCCLSLEGICFSKMPACIISSSSSLTRLAVAVKALEETDARILRTLPELTCINLVVGDPYSSNPDNADDDGALFFNKLRFCTTNVLPSALLRLRAPAPALEVLQFAATVEDIVGSGDDPTDLGFCLLPSLKQVTVLLNCWGASNEKVENAEAALRAAAKTNGFPIHVIRENKDSKVTVHLPKELGQENSLLCPELVKMRANQQISRRIILEKELRQLAEDLNKLETSVRATD